jgi:hypothetical protein
MPDAAMSMQRLTNAVHPIVQRQAKRFHRM